MAPTYHDIYSRYETGLQACMAQLDKADPHYEEALSFQQRLLENIDRARAYGSTDELEAERNEIVALLNDLCQKALGRSFNELCAPAARRPAGPARKPPWPLLLLPLVAALAALTLLVLHWTGVWPARTPTAAPTVATPPTARPTTEPTAEPTTGPTAEPTTEPTPPPATTPPAGRPTMAPLLDAVDTDPDAYIDNRSGPVEVLQSFYNAVNRHEYARAYSYWDPDRAPNFSQFQQAYEDVVAIQFAVGEVGGDQAAGSVYYNVAAVIVAQTADGDIQTYAACYMLNMSQPALYDDPPVPPLAIETAVIQPVAGGTDQRRLLDQACTGTGIPEGRPLTVQRTPEPDEAGRSFYIDNRSSPAEVLQSLCNALNRSEHARAYGYWDAASPDAPPYFTFREDYGGVTAVELLTGKVRSSGDAELYYRLPAALTLTNDRGTQRLVGCFTLHMWRADRQTIPPFQRLSITAAEVREVDSRADLEALLTTVCP